MQIPQNFDLRALQVFIVTAEQGGMTQSAKALGMTQSGVSQAIAALEDSVGSQLFDRSVRPIVLTSAGRSLFKRGEKILLDMQNAYLEASKADSKKLATLTIAMPDSIAHLVGPKLVRRKKDLSSYWRIWSGLTPAHREEFLSHAIDILFTEDANVSDIPGLERHSIFSEPYVLIFHKDYEGPTELGPHLESMDLMRYSQRSAAGRQTEAQLNRLRLDFKECVEFDASASQTIAVADGLGWGITTPICLMQRPGLIQKLKIAPISRGSFYRHISLITRQNSLGEIPRELAEDCRAILEMEIFPELFEQLPWLRELMLCRETRQIIKKEI